MSITRSPLRPLEAGLNPQRFARAAAVTLAVAAGGLAVVVLAQRAAPVPLADTVIRPVPVYDATGAMQDAIVPSWSAGVSVKPVPVYDATGAMLESIMPSGSGSLIVPNSHHYVVVDGAIGSQLAAEHPWTAESGLAPSSHRFTYVDGTTASHLAAEHPWASADPLPVYDATGAMLDAIQ